MPLVLKDRVQETSNTVGTGALTLLGAVIGYEPFASIGNGNSCYYTIQNTESGSEGEWEVGIGTYTFSGNILSRDTILSSSTGASLINFSAGSKIVFITYPAEKAVALSGTTPNLPENTIPFATSEGYLTSDNAFQYSSALNQASAPVFYSTNGIAVYSNLISYDYIIPQSSIGVSYSPIAVANNVSVTVSSGQRWVIQTI